MPNIGGNGVSNQIDYGRWLSEINKSNSDYEPLFAKGRVYPPLFFFGDPEGAVAATVGLNPSAREFSRGRKWKPEHGESGHLLERCRDYFKRPAGVRPHDYFIRWKTLFLDKIGISYVTLPRAVHFDFSPRATRSVSSLQKDPKKSLDLFLDLVKSDLKYFIEQLHVFPSIKHLYIAGSVTKKYYGIEFLEENSLRLGYTLIPVMPFKRGGPGQVGLYKLDVGDAVLRYLFFCSTSPSAHVEPHPLAQKARWLRKHYPKFLPSDQ